ncbi:hypothetical protein C6W96_28900 [Streptomyces sp. CS149]|nr:hypothetical protein C6W96_28900 [Streptomyces sp. CS149]
MAFWSLAAGTRSCPISMIRPAALNGKLRGDAVGDLLFGAATDGRARPPGACAEVSAGDATGLHVLQIGRDDHAISARFHRLFLSSGLSRAAAGRSYRVRGRDPAS